MAALQTLHELTEGRPAPVTLPETTESSSAAIKREKRSLNDKSGAETDELVFEQLASLHKEQLSIRLVKKKKNCFFLFPL